MSNETVIEVGTKRGFGALLDQKFHVTERGSTLGNEIGGGAIAFFIAVCALVMNTQIIGAQYGAYAGSYLAATILCFAGTLLLGLIANLPLVQTANMGLSSAIISMLSAGGGLTYYNLMAVTLVAAFAYLIVAVTPLKKLLADLLPAGVRKALPVALGLYTALAAVKNTGLLDADGLLVQAVRLNTLPRFYFWIAAGATLLFLLFKAARRPRPLLKTFGLAIGVMWVFGIVCYMDQFIGGQTAATVVYERLNLVVATDGAAPYNIAAGFATLEAGRVFTEGFDFSGYSGSVVWLFTQGVMSFLFLGLYTNTGNTEAAGIVGDFETENSLRKVNVIGALLNLAAPCLGVPPTSVGPQSSAASEDGAKTGLASLTAALGFLIAAFSWIFILFFATGTNGAGMWVNETETKLAVYVKDTFLFADVIMIFVGAAMMRGIGKVSFGDREELIPFLTTVLAAVLLSDLALGAALGVAAFALLHLCGADRKEHLASTLFLCVLMLFFAVVSLNGVSAGSVRSSSAGAAVSHGALDEVSGFTIDLNTGEYSFNGVDNAAFYVVRVFPVENGVESVSAEAQSDRIDPNAENRYSGVIDHTFLAGDYNAYVLAVASGYTPSTTGTSAASIVLGTPSLTANFATEGEDDEKTVTGIDITLTAGDSLDHTYTLTVEKDGKEIYKDSGAAAGPVNLTLADLGLEEATVEDSFTVTVTVNELPGYILPDAVSSAVTEKMGWPFGPGGPMPF